MTERTNLKRRLKYVATINDDVLGEDTDRDYELEYVDISNVDSSGTVNQTTNYTFAKAPSRARRCVRHGDVIVSCVRTYLQAIAPVRDPPDNLVVSTGFAVVRPREGVLDTAFSSYALREPSFLSEVAMRSVGVNYPAINASELRDIPVCVPSQTKQQTITAFLDHETSQIDALIAAKQRLLKLTFEKRSALITRSVTRGLNSNMRLRDSGISWLGRIPTHWDTERARWLLTERDARSQTGQEDLLSVSHLTGVTLRSEKQVNMFKAESTEGYKICRRGDLVVNTLWAWMGAMGVADMDGIVSPAYNVYEPSSRLSRSYLDMIVRLPVFAQEVTRHSKGVWSSRLRLYPEGLFETHLPVPPLSEQAEIGEFIATECSKLDSLTNTADLSVRLLQERRSALIAGAVAGRIDIGAET
ncbi:MAG: restriction endonuclease subunit S [Gammaproteobacteria bacterium]|nr:restriction endonuclease subunit S [Gammaproteobacteria bacterium]MDE0441796.1 restriction endonuclease subunit S [Gammaproteobacteria bacterium]